MQPQDCQVLLEMVMRIDEVEFDIIHFSACHDKLERVMGIEKVEFDMSTLGLVASGRRECHVSVLRSRNTTGPATTVIRG